MLTPDSWISCLIFGKKNFVLAGMSSRVISTDLDKRVLGVIFCYLLMKRSASWYRMKEMRFLFLMAVFEA